MTRTVALIVATAAVLATGPELQACGDKSLSAGGIRMQRALAARYPASVLAYMPSGSPAAAATRKLKLPETLRFFGHRFHEVASVAELRTSIETGKYNLVLADLADVAALERDLGPSSTRVVFVPIAYQLTKEAAREAARQRRFLITAPSMAATYLTTIAEAVAFASAGSRKG